MGGSAQGGCSYPAVQLSRRLRSSPYLSGLNSSLKMEYQLINTVTKAPAIPMKNATSVMRMSAIRIESNIAMIIAAECSAFSAGVQTYPHNLQVRPDVLVSAPKIILGQGDDFEPSCILGLSRMV